MTLTEEFRGRLISLARRYPRLARGGLNRRQLKDLARHVAQRSGFYVRFTFEPWPWPATVHRMGRTLAVTVDSRRHPADQLMALAHEVGHIALGHYRLGDFWTEVDGPYSREEDGWADLFAAIVLDKRTTPLEYLGVEQGELF